MSLITNNILFSIVLSLVAFEIGLLISKKTNIPIFNPNILWYFNWNFLNNILITYYWA